MGEYKTLSLSHLRVNPQNPRYRNPRISESDAILALFKEIKNNPETASQYMLNLIDDIVKNGINLAELPIVIPDPLDQNIYQVMEGNRRIAALKLLYFPDLAAKIFQAESRSLKRLEGFRKVFLNQYQEQYKEVLCVVFPSPKEVTHWIYLRHTGENEGRGVASWDKMAKDNFRLRVSAREHTLGTQIVQALMERDYIKTDLPVALSTLERMVRDPDVASKLHIEIEGGELRLSNDPQLENLALRALTLFALDTVEKDPLTKQKRLTSRVINRKQERIQYLSQVLDRILSSNESPPIDESGTLVEALQTVQPDPVVPLPEQTLSIFPSHGVPEIPSRPRSTQDYKKRRKVAAKGIKIEHSTLNNLYKELCQLDAMSYPHVGIIGIRVFLEGSLDVFIQQFAQESEFKDLMKSHELPSKISLSAKLDRVVKYLESHKILPADTCQAIRKYQSDQDNPLSINTLQAYLHNPNFQPTEDKVKYWWDAYHPLFEALWNNYNAAKQQDL